MPSGVGLTLPSIRNAVINGDCAVSQITVSPGTTFWSPANNFARWFNVDMVGIRGHGGGTNALTISDQQAADHPILGARGFCKSATATIAASAPAAGDACAIFTSIEGYNYRLLESQICTLSFWVKSPKTGVHCVAFTNGVDLSYVREFQVLQANTWEQKLVGIPFIYAGGTWDYTNGLGLRILFPFMAGTNYQTTPNGWRAGLFYATANQQNLLDGINNAFRVTDIQLETGLVGTAFDRLPFDVQLTRGQRYYTQSFTYGTVPQQNLGFGTNELRWLTQVSGAVASFGARDFPVSMRAAPTVTFFNPGAGNAQARDTAGIDCSGTSLSPGSTPDRIAVVCVDNAGSLAGNTIGVHYTADARI